MGFLWNSLVFDFFSGIPVVQSFLRNFHFQRSETKSCLASIFTLLFFIRVVFTSNLHQDIMLRSPSLTSWPRKGNFSLENFIQDSLMLKSKRVFPSTSNKLINSDAAVFEPCHQQQLDFCLFELKISNNLVTSSHIQLRKHGFQVSSTISYYVCVGNSSNHACSIIPSIDYKR